MSDLLGKTRHWRLDWRLLIFTGIFLPVLIGLGIWQLSRAGEKTEQLAQWQLEAKDLAWTELVASGLQSGRPVTLSGRYGERSWLLDNRTRDGAPGYEVLTVFHPLQGPPVLINRGWVLAPRTRDRLPDVRTPEGVLTLTGRLAEYPEPPVLTARQAAPEDWPRRVQSLPARVARATEPTLPGLVIRLADSGQAGAFRADWKPDYMGPQTHYGYAAQWFALAAALVILTVVASYRKTGADNDNDNG